MRFTFSLRNSREREKDQKAKAELMETYEPEKLFNECSHTSPLVAVRYTATKLHHLVFLRGEKYLPRGGGELHGGGHLMVHTLDGAKRTTKKKTVAITRR